MRRVRFYTHGGPEVLVTEEAGIPVPGPGQVLVRTEAIGVNYVDVQIRRETDPDSIYFRSVPATLTGDVVGRVEATGPDTDPALTGTRVAALLEDAYADYVVVDAEWLAGVPAELSAGAASMLPTVGAVALGALRTGRLGAGETVLVTAGADAIGHLAVQLARQRGAEMVIAAAGSPAKLSFPKELGADVVVNYSEPGWADLVRDAAPRGVDVVLEAVGGQVLNQCIGLLAPYGRAVVFGASSGDLPILPVRTLFALKSVIGFSLLALRAAAPEQARANVAELARLFGSGALRACTQELPLADAIRAHQMLEDRAVTGRLLLVP
ncbi:MAG: zinc-binding dehydrogenase [Streptosporangiaceae bacterium]|nr:zinc-binding dehydrogenase [Streptosporangiaceae bacterium]MBV9858463.1 zinc-binding dehydrogenase [Streptosporangiaceae bacterium]